MTIRPVTKRDISDMVRIEFAAYADDCLAKLLRARDRGNPAHHARATARYARMMDEESEVEHFTKITFGDTMLGWMRWELLDSGPERRFRRTPDSSSWLDAAECASSWQLDMIRTYHEMMKAQHLGFMADTPHMCTKSPLSWIFGFSS